MESIVIDGNEYQCTLGDNGTLDTEIEVYDVLSGKTVVWHYSQDAAGYYRDGEGCLDLAAFVRDTVGPDAAAYDWQGSLPEDYCTDGCENCKHRCSYDLPYNGDSEPPYESDNESEDLGPEEQDSEPGATVSDDDGSFGYDPIGGREDTYR